MHSTVEYTLNSVDRKKKLVEYLHTFMDFNKVFDRAWHEELLCVMRKFNIGETFTFFTDRDPGILNQMF